MAISESDRVFIRKYVGFSSLFTQRDPRLESAIRSIQSLADGGSQPDSSSENEMKALLYGSAAITGAAGVVLGPSPIDSSTLAQPARRGLIQIDAQIAKMDIYLGSTEVGKGAVKADAAREALRLRGEGRRLAGQLAQMLDTFIRRDAFTAGEALPAGAPAYARNPY